MLLSVPRSSLWAILCLFKQADLVHVLLARLSWQGQNTESESKPALSPGSKSTAGKSNLHFPTPQAGCPDLGVGSRSHLSGLNFAVFEGFVFIGAEQAEVLGRVSLHGRVAEPLGCSACCRAFYFPGFLPRLSVKLACCDPAFLNRSPAGHREDQDFPLLEARRD